MSERLKTLLSLALGAAVGIGLAAMAVTAHSQDLTPLGWPAPDAVLRRGVHAAPELLLCVTFDVAAQAPEQQVSCALVRASQPPSARPWAPAPGSLPASGAPLVGLLLAAAKASASASGA